MRAVAFPLKSSLQKRVASTDRHITKKTDHISLYIVLMSRNEQKNSDCSLNFQGNAQAWGKNTLIFAGKYHPAMFLPVLMIGGKCSCLRAKPAHIPGHLPLGTYWDGSTPQVGAMNW